MFESGENVKPRQGACAALGLLRGVLFDYPGYASAATFAEAMDLLPGWAEITPEHIAAFEARLKPFAFFTRENFGDREIELTHAKRALHACAQAILQDFAGNEVKAWRCVSTAALYVGFQMRDAYDRRERRAGSAKKLAADPKQQAKKAAHEIWLEWQAGKRSFTSAVEFAEFVMNEFPVLTSSKVISGWTTAWKKEKPPAPYPAS
jgi:hypothetical protein